MNAIYTVLRKELIDVFGDRHSLRGPLLQAGIVLLLVGIIVPALDDSIWSSPAAPVLLFQLFPAVIASMIAADAFAGERERGTLETLLATPLPESAIFIGKTLAAVTFALSVSLLSLTCAVIVAGIRFGELYLTSALLVSVLAGAAAASLVTSSIAVVISSYVDVARSAQQMSSTVAMLFVFGTAAALEKAEGTTTAFLLRIDLALIVAAIAVLMISARMFRRDRIFE
jgi:ABC-2 type transport system permease protein